MIRLPAPLRVLAHQTRYDLLAFLRDRQARFFTVALPVIFLAIFVSVFGNNHVGPEHIKASTYYVPGIAALAVLSASFSNLVIAITAQRELGVLKRRRATPVPAAVLIGGRATTALVISLLVTGIVIAIGAGGFGVHVAGSGLAALALSIAVASLAFACLGYAAASLIHSADGAQPTVLALTLPLSFISGVYIPSLQLPSTLRHIAEAFPLQHVVAAMSKGFLPHSGGVAWTDLGVVAAWGVVGLVFAIRRFRWVPAVATA
jgi:ABC-2 type transport system permease protein